jgi:hypothetical protein
MTGYPYFPNCLRRYLKMGRDAKEKRRKTPEGACRRR